MKDAKLLAACSKFQRLASSKKAMVASVLTAKLPLDYICGLRLALACYVIYAVVCGVVSMLYYRSTYLLPSESSRVDALNLY